MFSRQLQKDISQVLQVIGCVIVSIMIVVYIYAVGGRLFRRTLPRAYWTFDRIASCFPRRTDSIAVLYWKQSAFQSQGQFIPRSPP